MKVITQRTLIRNVAAEWRRQYGDHSTMFPSVLPRLRALNVETATAFDVEKIIGNDSWIQIPKCDECGRDDLNLVVEVGEQPDYESSTANLCIDCAHRAVALLLEAQKGSQP